MTPSQDEIAKLDKILLYLYKNKEYRIDDSFASDKLGMDKDEYNFLCLAMVDFSDSEEKIGDTMDAGSKRRSLKFGYETKRFIDNGSFKAYFDKHNQVTDKPIIPNEIHIGDRINFGDINQSNFNLDNSKHKSRQDQPIENPNQNIGLSIIELLSKYWWTLIIPIIGMYIYDKFCK